MSSDDSFNGTKIKYKHMQIWCLSILQNSKAQQM